jgi:hypothetical protein
MRALVPGIVVMYADGLVVYLLFHAVIETCNYSMEIVFTFGAREISFSTQDL